MKQPGFVLAALAAAPILALAQGPAPDPYTIYARTRAVWDDARYPDELTYTLVVRATEAGAPQSNHYHCTYDATRDVVSVNPISDEEAAHPYHVPPGPNISFFGVSLSKPEQRMDMLGVPKLAPNYSFGIAHYLPKDAPSGMELVREIRREYDDPAPPRPSSDPGGLKQIASVEAVRRDYVMTYEGIDRIHGHADYHLSLRPVHDPHRFRLRELWVNAHTYATDRLISDGNFQSGPGPGVQWTVDFARIAGAPVVATETAHAPLRYPGAIYSNVSVAFEDLHGSKRTFHPNFGAFVSRLGSLTEP